VGAVAGGHEAGPQLEAAQPKRGRASTGKAKASGAGKGGASGAAGRTTGGKRAAARAVPLSAAGKTLVIVESPAKAKTLKKILGDGYEIAASVGHVRDLPKGRLGVDLEAGFEPEYLAVRGKASLIRGLREASRVAERILLASDPDREGEAIAWHLATLLSLDPKSPCRIRMHEITESGVRGAVASPEPIDQDRVDAQQSRRVLDRLVGYKLSPLLWSKIKRGLSAGRVQSVALRLTCDREDEIDRFIPEEYWLIDLDARAEDRSWSLRVERRDGKLLHVTDEKQALAVEAELARSVPVVSSFRSREGYRPPLPPFRTSTLQQEASRRLGFAPRRTMRIAQGLYEGVELPGRGPVGLITYMRTDSLRSSPEAIARARDVVGGLFGEAYLPDKPHLYAAKGRAQDAHEAIRPTDPSIVPEGIKEALSPEQYRLYDLIWRRFTASQMASARIDRTSIEVEAGPYGLKQSGAMVVFEGWGKLWPLGVKDAPVPAATPGEELETVRIRKEQKFTQSPARYTEAALVKAMEEKGIGRPSTYATILETLSNRGYVDKDEEKKLTPTKLGRIVCAFLVEHFPDVMNVGFTASMEERLDRVESGDLPWRGVLGDFWTGFEPVLETVAATAKRVEVPLEPTGEDCPQCGKPLVVKRGRFGEFIACSGFPECRFTKKIVKGTGIACPKCGTGELVRRKATKGKAAGRFFYGCSRYPECDYVSWAKPKPAGSGDKDGAEAETSAREASDV
jgi:DNA topoisomerase-1